MIDVLQVLRDAVLIVAGTVVTVMVVLVGRAALRLERKLDGLRVFMIDAATSVVNPIKGALLAIGRIKSK